MARVRITGWEYGLQKIALTKTIRLRAGLELAAAHRCTNAVLKGDVVVLEMPTSDAAAALVEELIALGAIGEVAD